QQFGHISERVETEYFSFDIPESWGSNYTFTQTETGDGNFFTAGTWVLTNNDKIPDIPFSGGSSSFGSNPQQGFDESAHSITIAVGRFMGFPFSPCDYSYQTTEDMGEVSFSEKLQVAGPKDWKKLRVYAKYPNKAGGYYSDQAIDIPTKQQVDDAAYIMSTFYVK
ncbi:MAG: hypothetical protein RSB86_19600, partial [Comamonas sp.]|uniref:hypothetical protein n=1 Tax=Comamonas sp. TaxID=34028 RepID=UPI002FC8A023